ncbi:MAG: hypothetical protein ABIV43_00825, partial [Candidatus Saccharimonadales bacterium]
MPRSRQKSLESQFSNARYRTPFLFPMTVAIVLSIFQSLYAKTFQTVDVLPGLIAMFLLLVIIMVTFFIKNPSSRLKMVQYGSVVLITMVSFGF